mgnify:CR=1 FL=1
MSEQIDIEKELDEGRKPGNQTFFKKNSKNILIITRGHPFERDSFFDMIDSLGLNWSHIEHPAAQSFLKKERVLLREEITLLIDLVNLRLYWEDLFRQ